MQNICETTNFFINYFLSRTGVIFIILHQNTYKNMENVHFTGLSIAISTFLVIGLFHPIVIKVEYYFGVRLWWIFLLAGIAFIVGSMLMANVIASSILGVLGASCLWSIGELFEQKQRVKKGWFPMNPKRKEEYED